MFREDKVRTGVMGADWNHARDGAKQREERAGGLGEDLRCAREGANTGREGWVRRALL